MEYKEIKQLMDDMGNSKLDTIDIEFPDGTKISMSKNTKKEVIIQNEMPNQTLENDTTETNIEGKDENYKIIKSPMVGTFFSSSSPNEEPFVKVGDAVHKGNEINE